jgi:hypothetical protein
MPINASQPPKKAEPAEPRPLTGLERDDHEPTQAMSHDTTRVCFPQVSSLPRTPSKILTQTQRRSPTHSHTNATTTK